MPPLKPRTQERYRTSFRQLNPVFGNLYLDEITRARLADYASDRMKSGVKGATVRRDLATLSCMMSCAVSWDYIGANPVKQFSKRHIRESPPRTTYPTAEQVDRLVANAPPMTGRIIRFLAETGMRQEEVCSLEWSQVSIPRREVRLTKTKTSSPRVVPLSDAALGTLVGTPRQSTSPYVFWHADGIRYTTSPTALPWSHAGPECHSGATTCATPSPAGSYRPPAISQPFKRSSAIVRSR